VKLTRKHLLLAIWIVVATIILAHLWLTRPDLGPHTPENVSLWLITLYGSTNGENLRDLEALVALLAAFGLVSIATFATRFAWRRFVGGKHDKLY